MTFKNFNNPSDTNKTPYNTEIWLCKSVLDITSGHQLSFESLTDQIAYFTSPSRSIKMNENRYIKNKSGELQLDIKMNEVEGLYNYLIYRNKSHENKYYFHIIDSYFLQSHKIPFTRSSANHHCGSYTKSDT